MSADQVTDIGRENYDVVQENPPGWSPNGGIAAVTVVTRLDRVVATSGVILTGAVVDGVIRHIVNDIATELV